MMTKLSFRNLFSNHCDVHIHVTNYIFVVSDTNKKSSKESECAKLLPYDLKSAYVEMNGRFAGFLMHAVKEVVKCNTLEDIKLFLISSEVGVEEEVETVTSVSGLITYLRKRCYLSNFSFLNSLINYEYFENSKSLKEKLQKFTQERADFYQKIKATDFAKNMIEDHRTSEGHCEVRKINTYTCLFLLLR